MDPVPGIRLLIGEKQFFYPIGNYLELNIILDPDKGCLVHPSSGSYEGGDTYEVMGFDSLETKELQKIEISPVEIGLGKVESSMKATKDYLEYEGLDSLISLMEKVMAEPYGQDEQNKDWRKVLAWLNRYNFTLEVTNAVFQLTSKGKWEEALNILKRLKIVTEDPF